MVESQKRALKKYKAGCWRLTIDFYGTDADIEEYLKGMSGRASYIKRLIRDDMMKNKKEGEGQ